MMLHNSNRISCKCSKCGTMIYDLRKFIRIIVEQWMPFMQGATRLIQTIEVKYYHIGCYEKIKANKTKIHNSGDVK